MISGASAVGKSTTTHMRPRVPRKLTLALAGLMAAQAATGLTASNLYRDVAWIEATWFGNDWLTLVVAVPLLLVSGLGAQRGSARTFLLWAGTVGYALYNYAFYLLGAAMNVFFPFYVVSVVLAAAVTATPRHCCCRAFDPGPNPG